MNNTKWLMPSLALALTAGGATMAGSQTTAPAGNTPPVAGQTAAGAAQNEDRETRRQRLREQRRQELQNMTPEQRQQMMRQNRERIVTATLQRAGVTDVANQKAITDYITSEAAAREEASRALRTSLQKLQQAARTGAVTDAQLATLLNEYQNAAADEKARRQASERALDARIRFSDNARLRVLLVGMGAIGEEGLYSGAGMLGGRGGPAAPGAAGANGNRRGNGADQPATRPGARGRQGRTGDPANGMTAPAQP